MRSADSAGKTTALDKSFTSPPILSHYEVIHLKLRQKIIFIFRFLEVTLEKKEVDEFSIGFPINALIKIKVKVLSYTCTYKHI